MGIAEDLADDLARDVLKLVDATGNEDLIMDIAKSLAASSTTTQEAYMASIRVRQAVNRARGVLMDKAKAAARDAAAAGAEDQGQS